MIRSKYAATTLLCLLLLVIITNIYFIYVIVDDKTSKSSASQSSTVRTAGNANAFERQNDPKKEPIKMARKLYNHQNASTMAARKILLHTRQLPSQYLELNDQHRDILHRIFYDLTPSSELKPPDVRQLTEQWVTNEEIVPESEPLLGSVLKAICSSKIIKAQSAKRFGTQLKIFLTLEGNLTAIFKPQWYTRDHIIEGSVYAGKDRHNAEIAAFHLGLILGFRKIPLAVGRKISLHKEVMPVAALELLETFHQEGNNTCFYGVCYYCGPHDPICAKRDVLEGALVLWLPNRIKLRKIRHPWQRTYKDGKLARWEADEKYCDHVKSQDLRKIGGLTTLLDLIDASIFDFLIDNGDRHHFEITDNKVSPMVVLLDNGKSFGNPTKDHIDILAPLYQCCILRRSTYERLLLYTGGTLSIALEKSLHWSHIAPVLSEGHFRALDRRLKIVLGAISLCLKERDENRLPPVLL
ncbi:glycosaminoglycan xylosylkinase [Neocloeon triangulifer]|uniref:glycosaminoglycan xylosylkinase n=1 Tax=Neocloeon triangulifer TaxID=2078957 RepID=UPI00286F1F4B|nr:glycosaminoglycan xylosylkinase [Neocloeon triangulifer]XP_059481068.1 glycosaminoglycan xylosylkinase [Neocloeon triangulifer]XP_059481069.1 glycosaminoglycan xylosylkinase [Neocloeon triangulifer]